MECKHCGAEIKSNQSECAFCGCEVEHPQPERPQHVVINNYYGYKESENYANKMPQSKNEDFVSDKGNKSYIYNESKISDKNKIVALLLCIFFGIFGLHKFYVGKNSSGLLYLFTYGICGFGWIADIIIIATGNFKDKYDLKLQ